MELDACIKERRSVRAYTDQPVSKEHLDEVLEAGVWAPTGMGRQPWRFIIIENKELLKYISDQTKQAIKKNMPLLAAQYTTDKDVICYNAPMLVLICVEKDPQWASVDLLDCVLAAQNMFLKAHELGLGTCYMGFINLLSSQPEALHRMGVPENYAMMVPFIVGYPKTKQGSGKRNKPSILKWIK